MSSKSKKVINNNLLNIILFVLLIAIVGLFLKLENSKINSELLSSLNIFGDNSRIEPVLKIKESAYLNLDNRIHYLYWTGGYDSTYRLCEMLIVEKKKVQPIYVTLPLDNDCVTEEVL